MGSDYPWLLEDVIERWNDGLFQIGREDQLRCPNTSFTHAIWQKMSLRFSQEMGNQAEGEEFLGRKDVRHSSKARLSKQHSGKPGDTEKIEKSGERQD